jgi:hypothetical protein
VKTHLIFSVLSSAIYDIYKREKNIFSKHLFIDEKTSAKIGIILTSIVIVNKVTAFLLNTGTLIIEVSSLK